MLETVIGSLEAGSTLQKYVQKTFPNLPSSAFYKAVRNKKIKVNRKRADVKQVLCEGDHLLFFLPPDLLEQKKADYSGPSKLDIVYEDDNLLIVNKPAGLLSQKDEAGNQDCLDTRVKNYLFQTGKWDPETDRSFMPGVAHRLDRNTSGLVAIGKNRDTQKKLAEGLRNHTIKKWYRAKIDGELKEPVTIDILLEKEGTKAVPASFGKEAVTYVCPTEIPHYVLCELATGRFHQIRASLASIGHPLSGDKKYGSVTPGPYFLQAYKLDLSGLDLDSEQTIFQI